VRCSTCGFENLPEMRFCGRCGTRLGQVCTVCSFVNPPVHAYCGYCGARLAGEAVSTSETQAIPGELHVTATPSRQVGREQLPPGVASVPSRSELLQLEGERRLATVILADVVRSTDILERIGTEAWVHNMNQVLQILEAEVYRFGGVVDQFRGDGLVAFFGAKLTREDDPERAVLAAMGMHTALGTFAAGFSERYGTDLRLRVGVNTGEVIVASIGDDRQHSEDTAMGEAAALAARMESAAEPGTVLVSDNTYHLVESRFEWKSLGRVTVRGFSEPVAVYRPLRPRPGATSAHRLETHELSALLIGRESEFDVLNGEIDNLRAGRGSIVMVSGDTGMGKSSLIANVHQHAVRDDALLAKADGIELPLGTAPPRALTWLHGRCRSYDQSSPYSMWLDLLQVWLNVREGEPPTETRDRLYTQAEALWGDKLMEHYPYLATLLSLPLEDPLAERVSQLDAEGRREQFFLTLKRWVDAITVQAPLVVVFEDVHWADTTSLKLLEYCLPLCEHKPVLWLIVFRPDRTASAWEFYHRVSVDYAQRLKTLVLSSLTRAQAGKMIDELIGPDVLPAETRELLIDRAEGNPYYIEEFIHALLREGILVRDAETSQWHATRTVDSLDLPGSLQNLLLARLDRLEPEPRRMLQMASVIGSVFWSKVLQALVSDGKGLELEGVKEHLSALQRAQLIDERGQVPHLGMEYVFESNLIRDAAYERLLSVQRVTCHRRVADALEQIFGEKVLARYYSLLAYHYREAGAVHKELFYTVLAAEEARGIYANDEALEYYTRALQLLDEIEAHTADESQLYVIRTQRFEVLNGRREVYYLTADFKAGLTDARALLPLARQLDEDPVWLIDALLQQPGVGFYRNQEEAAAGVSMAEDALGLARTLGDRRREMQSLGAIASQRYYLNDPSWQEMAERALKLARELGDKRFEAGILTGIGNVYAFSDPERSTEYLEAALPIIEALDDKGAELELLNVLGVQLESSDDYVRRLNECHQIQLEISREIGHRRAEARALMFYGQIQGIYLGDHEGGLPLLEECRRMWEGIPDEIFPLLRIAQVRIVQGRYDEAQQVLDRIHRVDEENVHDVGRAGVALTRAIFFNVLGDEPHLREVLELTARAYRISSENPQLSQQYQMAAACEAAAAHMGLIRMLGGEDERRHHLHLAMESSQLALDIYRSFGYVRPIECTSEEILYRHSLALRANGHDVEANAYLQQAFDEMMRKHDLIPSGSHFRRTYLENIPLHREIRSAVSSGLASGKQVAS
jgi:predicted ATPase/class 3 adenylate cyclase